MSDLNLGRIITDGAAPERDAIHVAVYKMLATCVLRPGQHLRNGVVDPFLQRPVQPGERFWLFLYENTVTALRHDWEHPSFPRSVAFPPVATRRSEAAVWAEQAHRSFDALPVPPVETA